MKRLLLALAFALAGCETRLPGPLESNPSSLIVYVKEGPGEFKLLGRQVAEPEFPPDPRWRPDFGCPAGTRSDPEAFHAWYESEYGRRSPWISDEVRPAYYYGEGPVTFLVLGGADYGVGRTRMYFHDFAPGDPDHPEVVLAGDLPPGVRVVDDGPSSCGVRKEYIRDGDPADPRTGLPLQLSFSTINPCDSYRFLTETMTDDGSAAPGGLWFEVFFVPRRFCIPK